MSKQITRRNFLKATALSALSMSAIGAAVAEEKPAIGKAGLAPVFDGYGSKYEYGHFTVEATVIDANSEEFNTNASFSIYHIMDYTAAVPYASSLPTNGATTENNTASMYVITSGDDALLIDLGNGPANTAKNHGENKDDEAVVAKINEEYRDLVLALADGRNLKIAITHKHGDHVGYSTAFEGMNMTVYFPEGDSGEKIVKRFETYDFQTFVPGEFTIPVGEIVVDTVLCPGHTNASTIFVINTPVITYNYGATNASASYVAFIGDAIGSGSSVWLFNYNGMKLMDENIDAVIEKLESYTAFDACLGKGEETGAKMLLLGGHGWQYENAFGTMRMDIEYAKSMQNLIHAAKDSSKWAYDGVDGLDFTEWMKLGKVALKDVGDGSGRYTCYFGTTLTSAAGITGSLEGMRQYAGQIPLSE